MKSSDRLAFACVSASAFVATSAWVIWRTNSDVVAVPIERMVLVCGLCVVLYLTSHGLRAVRLAVIGVSVHKTSFRTLALLNLSVAPWSMILPFKLDEIIRINELRSLNRSLQPAIMTLVIDRSMDGPMLLISALFLGASGASGTSLVVGLAGVIMLAITLGFFVSAQLLHFVQQYIFLYHYKPRALRTLQIINRLRELVQLGRTTIIQTAPVLLLCTIGIWLCEIAAVGLMLGMLSPGHMELASPVYATLTRANSGWLALLFGTDLGFPAVAITVLFTASLLLVWPFAIVGYVRRRRSEVRDAEFLQRQWGVGGRGKLT